MNWALPASIRPTQLSTRRISASPLPTFTANSSTVPPSERAPQPVSIIIASKSASAFMIFFILVSSMTSL